jgi:hypothetical protein
VLIGWHRTVPARRRAVLQRAGLLGLQGLLRPQGPLAPLGPPGPLGMLSLGLGMRGQARAAPAAAGPAVWAWTHDALWRATAAGCTGPWPLEPGAPAPAPAPRGLWLARRGLPEVAGTDGATVHWHPLDTAGLPLAARWSRPLPAPAQQLVAADAGRWAACSSAAGLHLIDRLGPDTLLHAPLGLHGQGLGGVRGLAALPGRRSLLVDWAQGGEWWELSLDPAAAPVYDGLVHDWRLAEGLPRPGYRHPRRLALAPPSATAPVLRATWPQAAWALAQDADGLLVVHLDVRRSVWRWPGRGLPAPAAAWLPGTRLLVACAGRLLQIDTRRWQLVDDSPLPGPPDAAPALLWPQPDGRGLRLLHAGAWWQQSADGRWAPDDELPVPAAVPAPATSPDAPAPPAPLVVLAASGHWAGACACITVSAGGQGNPAGPARLWCRPAAGPAWTATLPPVPAGWRGLAIQPDQPGLPGQPVQPE